MNEFETMGIINLTPDSFSDGGEVDSKLKLINTIENFKRFNVEIYDFGAESTAPQSNPIDGQEEIKRFNLLLENFESLDFTRNKISIDTYRLETFKNIYNSLRGKSYNNEIIWNDVSGIVNSEKIEALKSFENVSYVLSHNLSPSIEETSNHMNYVDDNLDVFSVIGKLKEGLIKLSFFDQSKIIIDLCFGFSKNMDQNYMLLKNVRKIVNTFDREQRWLWGLSRKSMFSKLYENEKEDSYFQSDIMQTLAINEISKATKNSIFRVHDPRVTNAIKNYGERVYAGPSW